MKKETHKHKPRAYNGAQKRLRFGDEKWSTKKIKQLRLENTNAPRGRPKLKTVPDTFSLTRFQGPEQTSKRHDPFYVFNLENRSVFV